MRLSRTLLATFALGLGLEQTGTEPNITPANPNSDNWPSWRGPTQDGHSKDATVPLQWSRTKNLKWQVDLPGTGNSSPIVSGNRIFLTGATKDGSERWVICIDRTSGKILWQRTAAQGLPAEPVHAWNTHASATCATDGQRLYAFFGAPGLFCYDVDGKPLWSSNFGPMGASTGWGAGAGSPALFDDLVFVNGDQGALRGQTDEKGIDYGPSWLWALNKRSGTVVWKTQRNQGMGWCTPVIWSGAGKPELVLNGQLGVWSYDPRTGQELWRVTGRKEGEGFGEVTPIWGHDLLYVFTGKPGPAWAIRPGGKGDISKTHVTWQIQRKDRDVSSPILVGDHIYTMSRIGVTTCLEAKSGEEVWRERLGGQPCASLVCIRGKVMFLNEEGTAFIIEPGMRFKLLHENRLGQGGEEFRASPAIVDGQLLIRSAQRLYCIANDDDRETSAVIDPEIRVLGGHKGSVLTVAFAPNGKLLASAARDHVIKLWDVPSGKLLRTLEGHDADIYTATFSRDGKLLVTASADKTVRLWNLETGKVQRILTGHTDVVRSVVFSHDGKALASGGKDEMIRLWDAATWKPIATIQAHSLRGLSISPGGATLASGGTDATVRLWDARTGKLRAILKGHKSSIEAVAFAPNGELLASSSADSTVRLWNQDGMLVRPLEGHTSEIDSIAFSPDGKILASGSKDKTLKLWYVESGKLLRTVTGAQNRLESLAFSPDGKILASGSGGPEALVRIYDFTKK